MTTFAAHELTELEPAESAPIDDAVLPAGVLGIAATASIGAGLIHVAAVGAHNEHDAAMAAFAAVAIAQVGLGALALAWRTRLIAAAMVAVSLGALAGFALAKVSGIPFIDGLDEKEPIQLADGFAAALAAITLLAAGAALLGRGRSTRRPLAVGLAAVLVAGVSVPAVVSASSHRHGSEVGVAADHHGADGAGDAAAEHAVVPPKPYDPTKPIDLGGVEGVTPEEQAKAENLLAVTLLRLPRFADPAVAEAAGFRSIGDAITGFEHFVNWKWIDDDKILDPDYPESLVYRVVNGQRTLQAAMFMLRKGDTLENVPTDIGGRLVQWHVHTNLCYTPDPEAPRVAGLTLPDGTCRPPLVKGLQIPMVHVWIVPHQCGPFAALEGVGAGQIKPGETRLCDHAHGAPVVSVPSSTPASTRPST